MSPQKRPEAVRWGCREHRTPRGIPCQHCADQGALFPRTAARRGRRKPPPDGPTETGR
jgi:hypothetical protein